MAAVAVVVAAVNAVVDIRCLLPVVTVLVFVLLCTGAGRYV